MHLLSTGEKYVCLTVLERYTEDEAEQGEGKAKLILYYSLRCICGNEFTIKNANWRKRKKDCGCGAAESEGLAILTTSLPIRVKREVDKYADENNLSTSKAAAQLLEFALLQLKGDDNAES